MYQILVDYGSDGWSLNDEKFTLIDEAVKYALKSNWSAPFLIVKVVDWQAFEK